MTAMKPRDANRREPTMADERADARKWMEIADQRAIEVATLKVENERLRARIADLEDQILRALGEKA